MLIACKCLNVILSSGQIDQNFITSGRSNKLLQSLPIGNLDDLQKIPRTSRIHTNCLEFLKLAIGPISDVTITINQNDLVYKVPIEPWYLHYCINCNKITHAKHNTDTIYLINSNLLTNNEEINSLKSSKSYSSAFGILMIDCQPTTPNLITSFNIGGNNSNSYNINGTTNNMNNDTTLLFQFNRSNSVSSNSDLNKQQIRLRGLNNMVQNRLQKEIQDTNERIRRYTEQQFALLKCYREKTEQEYQILVSLVNQVPEQLRTIDAIDNIQNLKSTGIKMTITTTAATATTSVEPTTSNITRLSSSSLTSLATTATATKISSNNSGGAIDNTQQPSLYSYKTQQVSSLDTPPATPDSTPMSVGNSPTFRQQTNNFANNGTKNNSVFANNTNSVDDNDCLFELEGLENFPTTSSNNMSDVDETEDAEDCVGDLDSGIPITKLTNRRGSQTMARSLPISIFNNLVTNTGAIGGKFNYEDLEEEIPEDSAVDIAASIKALAKSVHGDTIFGDLPRPRFSTQI